MMATAAIAARQGGGGDAKLDPCALGGAAWRSSRSRRTHDNNDDGDEGRREGGRVREVMVSVVVLRAREYFPIP